MRHNRIRSSENVYHHRPPEPHGSVRLSNGHNVPVRDYQKVQKFVTESSQQTLEIVLRAINQPRIEKDRDTPPLKVVFTSLGLTKIDTGVAKSIFAAMLSKTDDESSISIQDGLRKV